MSVVADDLWTLTFARPWIDADQLAAALEQQVARADLDHRTQLLVRDSLGALRVRWGHDRFVAWLNRSPAGAALQIISELDLGTPGFPTLSQRVMESLKPERIREFLRELGTRLPEPARIVVGGSIALILNDQLNRATEDVDVVDEVPVEIRSRFDLLEELANRYGLRITHFQSHYLPSGWQKRVRSFARFGSLDVELIDTCDIFVGKLFSARTKDRDDLRMLARNLDKQKIESRLRDAGRSLSAIATLAQNASTNWYIIYGESLPS